MADISIARFPFGGGTCPFGACLRSFLSVSAISYKQEFENYPYPEMQHWIMFVLGTPFAAFGNRTLFCGGTGLKTMPIDIGVEPF